MNDFNKAYELTIRAEKEQNAWNYLNAQSFFLDAVKYYLHVASDNAASDEMKEKARIKCDECLNRADELRILIMQEHTQQFGPSPPRLHSAELAAETRLFDCVVMERPDVKWDGVVGLEETWRTLLEVVHFPIKFPHLFTGKRKPENVLLIGDFGVDKCHLVKAVATEAGCSWFLYLASTQMFSRRRGKRLLVRRVFQLARQNKPCIIFIDDIDSFSSCRPSSAARREFLGQMLDDHSMNNGVFVIGSSSDQMNLDDQILRRFQKTIYNSVVEESHDPSLLSKINNTERSPDLTEPDMSSSTKGLLSGDVIVDHGCYRGSSVHNINTACSRDSEHDGVNVRWESVDMDKNSLRSPVEFYTRVYFCKNG